MFGFQSQPICPAIKCSLRENLILNTQRPSYYIITPKAQSPLTQSNSSSVKFTYIKKLHGSDCMLPQNKLESHNNKLLNTSLFFTLLHNLLKLVWNISPKVSSLIGKVNCASYPCKKKNSHATDSSLQTNQKCNLFYRCDNFSTMYLHVNRVSRVDEVALLFTSAKCYCNE